MRLPDGLEPMDPLTWRTVVARCLLGSSTKLVAYTCANYASPNGADVRPGVKLLMKDTELGDRTVRDALARLREVGLLYRVFEASATGLKDLADEYRLTFPDDLESRVAMWDPKRRKVVFGGVEQAPPQPHTRRKRTQAPATDAGGGPVDNSPENHPKPDNKGVLPASNHRQLLPEPPATVTGTTGNSCRPPSHAPSHSPSQDSGSSPYGAEVEGEAAARRAPSAPIEREEIDHNPGDYAAASAALGRLPDLGAALLEQARADLPAGTPLAALVIHAATALTRRTA